MKKIQLVLGLLCCSLAVAAQRADYKVVFDLTSRDTVDQKNMIRWLKEISESNPDAKMEVVMYAKGLELVVKDKSYVAEDVTKLATNKNISFSVCAIAMKNNNITADQLLPGVHVVPDGIYEIISKQRDGWGYIKAAR
ncbi:MAG TPA: DsrE family protein [Puia sp.]|jgi:intracellular sulfur oxidation DsrE/DsrF family protein|nr:DsrE family protein [Puia sp.]